MAIRLRWSTLPTSNDLVSVVGHVGHVILYIARPTAPSPRELFTCIQLLGFLTPRPLPRSPSISARMKSISRNLLIENDQNRMG